MRAGPILYLSLAVGGALALLSLWSKVSAALSLIVAVVGTLRLLTLTARLRRAGHSRRSSLMLLVVLSAAAWWIPVYVAALMPWLQFNPLAFYMICGLVLLGMAGTFLSMLAVRLLAGDEQLG